jgi:hypothetical protein
MNTRGYAEVPPIGIMTAIEMTIFWFSGTQNYRGISTSVVSFPLSRPSRCPTIQPPKLLSATFASAFSVIESEFYLLFSEFISIRHFLKFESPRQKIRLFSNRF